MESALASVFISLRDSISGLIFVCAVTLIIVIIMGFYIVSIQMKVKSNENKLKGILYVVRDIKDELEQLEDKEEYKMINEEK